MSKDIHCHSFNGRTTLTHEHRHGLWGITSEEGNRPGHTHRIAGYITFNHGHEHYYSITTGPDLSVENGHIHYYQGISGDNHNHLHFIYGCTYVSR